MIRQDQEAEWIENLDSGSMRATDARQWAQKARVLARPLLQLPHAPTAFATVETVAHERVASGPFGGWMLTWPEAGQDRQLINHLPNGSAFLRLLKRAYAPVLSGKPRLARLLDNRSRLEMSVTNDVLQVQLVTGESAYSMIRHHALMLFEATLWLGQSDRNGWGELYSTIADFAMAERARIPSMAELADIEAAGFEAMRATATASIDTASLNEVLRDSSLEPIVEYQIWATVGMAVLWRDFAAREVPTEMQWHDEQLGRYQDEAYLSDILRKWL
jgi:hypothetical protein